MARWLCRLQPEQLHHGPDSLERAEGSGVFGWVLCGLKPFQLAQGPECWIPFLNPGSFFALEINATVDDEALVANWPVLLAPWLSHPRVVQWFGRPLLLWMGSAEQVASLSACVLSVQSPLEKAPKGFAGVAEYIDSTPTDYRRFLQFAHARRSPDGLLIPAVRALSSNEQTGWRHASAESYEEWLNLSNATADLLCPDQSSVVLLESWNGHQAWYRTTEAMDEDCLMCAELPIVRRCWGIHDSCHWALLVHGFYLDRLGEMLEPLVAAQDGEGCLKGLDLYLSIPVAQVPQAVLKRQGWKRCRFSVWKTVVVILLHFSCIVAAEYGHIFC